MRRIAILGNAGSGKSYLARALEARYQLPVLDLDDVFWLTPGDYTTKRPPTDVRAIVDAEAHKDSWVVEGVYGELIEPFLLRAERLVWLDLSWEVAKARIVARQQQQHGSLTSASFAALFEYAGAYWQRGDARSHAGHGRMFEAFGGVKHRLTSETAVNTFIAQL